MIEVPAVIKTMLHNDTCPKNIRIHFPNGERTDICNDLIVKNSVSFTESLCSQNTLKFGLCESPIFECEVVGVGNVKGATIEVSCEIYCDASVTGAEWRVDIQKYVYAIPYGTFVVDECKRQADLQHRKIKAYTVGVNGSIAQNPFFYLLQNKILDMYQTTYTIDLATLACCLSNAKKNNALIDTITEQVNYSQSSFTVCELGSDLGHYSLTCWAMLDVYRIPYADRGNLFYLESTPYISSCIQEYYNTMERLKEKYGVIHEGANPHFFQMESIYGAGFLGAFLTPEHPNILRERFFPFPDYSFVCPKLDLSYEEQLYSDLDNRPQFACVREFVIKVRQGGTSTSPVVEEVTIPVREPGNSFKVYEATLKNDIFHYTLSTLRLPFNTEYILDKGFDFSSYLSAYVELLGMFCGWERDGYNFVNISQQFGLTPRTDLYPGSSLKPQGVTGGKLLPKDYQSCWYDDAYTKKYGAIVCEFKTIETIEGEQKVIDASYTMYLNGFDEATDPILYSVYEIKGNKIISDKVMVIEGGEVKYVDRTWTPQQIADICTGIAANLDGVTYMPVDFVGRGLPYVEAGDTFEILTRSNDSITTIVLNRTLKGEQTLTDSYKSV